MPLGIDIYRYQTVTDPAAVKRFGTAFAYVKLTDGGGPAIVKGDHQVGQMNSAGIPVGGYHYAQLTPSPEDQARVFDRELDRLGAKGLPPALDLEDPHKPGTAAREFTIRFIREMNRLGYPRVTLYANTSMLTGINADQLGLSDVVLWAANYGANDGVRHALPTRWKNVPIHQYTSNGIVPGINGRVDLNHANNLDWINEGVDMPLTDADAALVANKVWAQVLPGIDPVNPQTLNAWVWLVGANQGAWAAATREMPAPDGLAEHITQALLPAVQATLHDLDGMSEEDADRFVEALAARLARPTT